MFADVTGLNGNEANSLVMVDTKGQGELIITPKTALPTVEKKVKDSDDSEDNSITDNAWHDSADHDFGDNLYKITLPKNFIVKKDAETGNTILLPNVTFKIKNVDTYAYVEQKIDGLHSDVNTERTQGYRLSGYGEKQSNKGNKRQDNVGLYPI